MNVSEEEDNIIHIKIKNPWIKRPIEEDDLKIIKELKVRNGKYRLHYKVHTKNTKGHLQSLRITTYTI